MSVGEQTPLSDEARFLQRLAEPELPPGASDAERAAARADAAAGVEHAANELGGHWAEAYQELHPDWQPPPTDIEISNQRAAELSRNIIGRNVYQDLHNVYSTLNDFDLSSDEARRRVLLFLHGMSMQNGWGWAAPPQPPVTPFTGQGNRLGE